MRWFELHEGVKSPPKVTVSTKREVVRWTKNPTIYPLSTFAVNQLISVPGIRPEQPVTVFRGLLFRNETMAKPFRDRGERGQLSFTETLARPTSWTTERYVADGFAQNYDFSSEIAEMMFRANNPRHKIDGEFGVVISMVAQPNDIICEIACLGIKNEYHHENEFILNAGTYQMTIVQAWDPDGEISRVSQA